MMYTRLVIKILWSDVHVNSVNAHTLETYIYKTFKMISKNNHHEFEWYIHVYVYTSLNMYTFLRVYMSI